MYSRYFGIEPICTSFATSTHAGEWYAGILAFTCGGWWTKGGSSGMCECTAGDVAILARLVSEADEGWLKPLSYLTPSHRRGNAGGCTPYPLTLNAPRVVSQYVRAWCKEIFVVQPRLEGTHVSPCLVVLHLCMLGYCGKLSTRPSGRVKGC